MKNLQITAYGATDFVGRSAFVISDRDRKIMLDCGIELVPGDLSRAPRGVDEIASELDAFILSHAHIDHSGYVPRLDKKGYSGDYHMTQPTKDIGYRLWLDHLKIEGTRHWSEYNLDNVFNNIKTHKYRQKFKIADGITAEFYNAGHILGAAQVLIDWEGTLILYSGDINDRKTPLFDGFEYPDKEIDVLITESTNGKRYVPERSKINVGFKLLTKQVVDGGHKMILPSFAVGRSQELLSVLALDHDLDDIPIYTDGMINSMNDLTEGYLNRNWVSQRFLDELKDFGLFSPFQKDNIVPISSADKPSQFRKQIATSRRGAAIVTTSGMLEGGPIHSYLEILGKNEKNTIGFSGYQVDGTIGRQLYDGNNELTLFGNGYYRKPKKITVKCQIMKFPYSGHSSVDGLKAYMEASKAKEIYLVHGSPKNQAYIQDYVKDVAQPKILGSDKPTTLLS